LMSSKSAEIERLSDFKDNVVSTLTKPFTNESVQKTLHDIFGESIGLDLLKPKAKTTSKRVSRPSIPSQLRILLERGLKRVAGHIPALEQKRLEADPKAYYLPYLLHPDLVNSIERLESQQNLGDNAANYPEASGVFDSEATYELLKTLSLEHQTGRLDLIGDTYSVEIYLHKGMAVGVSTKDTNAYLTAMPQYEHGSDEIFEKARKQQQETGQPLILEDPNLLKSGEEILSVLKDASENLIGQMLSKDCHYRYWSGSIAPQWAINYSINQNIAEFFLNSLRRIHGWAIISRQIGDLVTRFSHRYTNASNWHRAHLTSFEAVVYDFLKYEYSVTELASTLGEVPSRVAEAVHTLYKLGILTKSKQPDPESIHQEIYEDSGLLVISSNEELLKRTREYGEKNDISVHHFSNTKDILLAAKEKAFEIVIDDGSSDDGNRFEAIQKLQSAFPDLIVIIAYNEKAPITPQEIVRLKAFEYLPSPAASSLKQALDSAVLECVNRENAINEDVNELDSVNARLTARQRQLDQIERELQKREHELLQNEEVFFEKCNRFEEERARLDILQDNYSNF
ncbi:MAG: hypothetical protein AAGH40_09810, partial [Verrucomicrobiota bacterium]